MADQFHMFPAETLAALTKQLLVAPPGSQLRLRHEGDHAFLKVIPPAGHPALALSGTALDPFPELNDSYVCPGDPRCPH